jgi:hypothetical protein
VGESTKKEWGYNFAEKAHYEGKSSQLSHLVEQIKSVRNTRKIPFCCTAFDSYSASPNGALF